MSQYCNGPIASRLPREPGERASGDPGTRAQLRENLVRVEALRHHHAMVEPHKPDGSGLSNSPIERHHITAESVVAGIDTFSLAWSVPESCSWWKFVVKGCELGQLYDGGPIDMPMFQEPVTMRRMRRDSWVSGELVSGVRLMVFGRARLVCFEGRLVAFMSGDPEARGLAIPSVLPAAEQRGISVLADLGIPVGREKIAARLRRLDLASDLQFAHSTDGLEVLGRFGDAELAGHKTVRWSFAGRVETAQFNRNTNALPLVARVYDRGVRTGEGEPGRIVRFEAQHRWDKRTRSRVADLDRSEFPDLALTAFRTAASSSISRSTDAGGLLSVAEVLFTRAEAGSISREAAFRLVGTAAAHRLRSASWWESVSTPATRAKHYRELQAALGALDLPTADCDLGRLLDQLSLEWSEVLEHD